MKLSTAAHALATAMILSPVVALPQSPEAIPSNPSTIEPGIIRPETRFKPGQLKELLLPICHIEEDPYKGDCFNPTRPPGEKFWPTWYDATCDDVYKWAVTLSKRCGEGGKWIPRHQHCEVRHWREDCYFWRM
jgi:hypothetical protein